MEHHEFINGTINIFIPLASALLGTIIGGIISYFSVRSSDNRKWKQEKIDRVSIQRTEAIGMALEWCKPIRKNILKAQLLTGSFLQEWLQPDDLRSQWPDMLSTLTQLDLPARLQVWLPPDTYQRAVDIAADVNNFVSKIDSFPSKPEEWHELFVHYSAFFSELRKKLDSLESDLSKAYMQAFR